MGKILAGSLPSSRQSGCYGGPLTTHVALRDALASTGPPAAAAWRRITFARAGIP